MPMRKLIIQSETTRYLGRSLHRWVSTSDIGLRWQSKLTKVEKYTYRPQLLMSVYIKMKAFELTRTINEVFPVVEFEFEREGESMQVPRR